MNIPKAATKLFSAKIGGQIIGFIGLIYFARSLGAEQLGIFFLFQAAVSLLAILSDFGIREGIEKRVSEGENPSKYLTSGMIMKLLLVSIVGLLVYIFRDYTNAYIGGEVAVLLIAALVCKSFVEAVIHALRGELRVGETASLEFARQLIWVGAGAILILMGLNYNALIYSYIGGLIVVLLWGLSKLSMSFDFPSRSYISSIWEYSKYSFIGAIGGTFYSWIDVIVIGFFLTSTHVGAYEMAWRIAGAVTMLSGTIAFTVFPQVSKWDAEQNIDKIEELLPKALTASFFLVIPALFGTVVLSQEILGILFGDEFVIASLVLITFMVVNLIQAVTVITSRVLRAIGHPKLVAKARMVSITLNVSLNILFVWLFGIVGAAIATGFAFTVFSYLVLLYLKRYIRIHFWYYEIGWFVFASSVMALIVLSIKLSMGIESLPQLFAVIGLGVTIYITILLIPKKIRMKITNLSSQITA